MRLKIATLILVMVISLIETWIKFLDQLLHYHEIINLIDFNVSAPVLQL